MFIRKLAIAGLLAGLGLGMAGCTDGYGYGGASLGYGSGYYADPYYGGGYGGVGYAPSYFGWYNDFYYPGTGVYVYDRYRRPFRWNDSQRQYWQGRRGYGLDRGDRRELRQNWADFARDRRGDNRDFYRERRDDRQALRNGTINRDQFRAERRDARQDYRREFRQDRRSFQRENRRDLRRR